MDRVAFGWSVSFVCAYVADVDIDLQLGYLGNR
jgi:hypothetical protein